MSERHDDGDTTPAAAGAREPGGEPQAPDRSPRRARRRTVALVSGGLGLAVLAGAGFWAYGRLGDADRTAPTQYWNAAGDDSAARSTPAPTVAPNALVAKLLPIPVGYENGPDLDPEGNDFSVSAERAAESLKSARTGLSAKEREERDKVLAAMKFKGVAGRSYLPVTGGLVSEIRLTQADPAALAPFSEAAEKLIGLLGQDGEAPKIDGFPEARCAFHAVIDEDDKSKNKGQDQIDALECVAVEGDVLVTFRTYGTLHVKNSADLFKSQLNHLKSPGESA
ncbi:hypothetical protein [Streptomyces subrutilus]|uniref:Uncharacterized protein n=1 Tax=Streptomyces subrutilus TaxID=36818 RepID=A0A5P2ULA0_9ACTN|nr:hypothetical protein [Streptomyces subrutilus]QEU80012.1 hypothetical protein CP968_18345 [Streptomyces subrutilus]WSJ30723.1 hypothetical protein OG479_16260 [Streptomyces subrutilus]GGZ51209.1 hypothetical protein GCM10010371_08650 [Streptomyces subrutilus]